jgi:hypothetical protein
MRDVGRVRNVRRMSFITTRGEAGRWAGLEVAHEVGEEVAGFRRFSVDEETSAADVVGEFD